jgi:putative transposase
MIHKTTTSLAKNFDVIVVESLNVTGMVKNRSLAKAVSDAAFGEFARQLQYKTTWYGSTLITADRWFPSSKTCSDCGAVKTKLLLSEREYLCSACGTVIDRDVNAAVNLARLGVTSHTESASVSGRGGERKTRGDLSHRAATVETSISQPQVA